MKRFFLLFGILFLQCVDGAPVSLGVDCFFEDGIVHKLSGKRVALAINHTSLNRALIPTVDLFLKPNCPCTVVALFSPEHGIDGKGRAEEKIASSSYLHLPVHSLHGAVRRPTQEMLQGVDCVIYDIQCTGNRGYTYPSMLFYIMEECAKLGIQVIVLDRPNPVNGLTVDGPMLEDKWRSYIGYINVPYCHGMTIGELARFFNEEYGIHCKLDVIPMKGWTRSMSFRDTGLPWTPPSPNIPEADTPMYSLMTGILGELQLVSIGVGYTMPFKIVGAPWIQAPLFAEKLNAQKLPGVYFQPFYFRPFYGLYKGLNCEGVLIQITDLNTFRPVATQYLMLGMLKSLYPAEFAQKMASSTMSKDFFSKANGTDTIYEILMKEKYPAWKLIECHRKERELFLEKRHKYLLNYPER